MLPVHDDVLVAFLLRRGEQLRLRPVELRRVRQRRVCWVPIDLVELGKVGAHLPVPFRGQDYAMAQSAPVLGPDLERLSLLSIDLLLDEDSELFSGGRRDARFDLGRQLRGRRREGRPASVIRREGDAVEEPPSDVGVDVPH